MKHPGMEPDPGNPVPDPGTERNPWPAVRPWARWAAWAVLGCTLFTAAWPTSFLTDAVTRFAGLPSGGPHGMLDVLITAALMAGIAATLHGRRLRRIAERLASILQQEARDTGAEQRQQRRERKP